MRICQTVPVTHIPISKISFNHFSFIKHYPAFRCGPVLIIAGALENCQNEFTQRERSSARCVCRTNSKQQQQNDEEAFKLFIKNNCFHGCFDILYFGIS